MNIFKLEEYLSQYEFSAQYLLCCSDAESFTMNEIIAMASDEERKLWESLSLGYTQVQGLPLLKETIANQLYPSLSSNNILTFAGAEEAIFCALYQLIDSNDHIIALTPCYQSLIEIPRLKGASIAQIELKQENHWRIDLELIKKNIQKNTKCIIINFPHNPTGQIIEKYELEELVSLCKYHNIWLFSDEVYRLLGTPKNEWAPPAACLYDKALSIGVMSKAFGLAGLRVGWIACQNTLILKKIECMKHYTSICNSAPSEILTMIAINNQDTILSRNNTIAHNNLQLLNQFFNQYKHLFSWIEPEGGCVGFVEYKAKKSVEEFCQELMKEKSTLLIPGSIYQYPKNFFRIGFGRKNMNEALNQLKNFLEKI